MVYCLTPILHSTFFILNYQQLFTTACDEMLITHLRNPHKISDICHPVRVMNQTL